MFGYEHPTGRKKPAPGGMTAVEAADALIIPIDILRIYIRDGCLPSPLYVGGYPVFSPEYLKSVDAMGISLPGTHPVVPSKWLRAKDPIPPHEREQPKKQQKHKLHGKPGPKAGGQKGGTK